ncbi:MAG: FAD-binding oxidoreductase [Acidimicrobiales bacterium]
MTELLDDLRRACPAAAPRVARDSDVFGDVMPEVVVSPRSTGDVAAVVQVAAARGRTVAVRGAGTKLDFGAQPTSAQVLVDLSLMSRLLEHARGDLVVRAETGAKLAEVNGLLGLARQQLPIDEVVPGSSIGGIVATGLSGPSRYLHGAVRDLVIGVTVVRADGIVAHAGSKVAKNVAGYDLAKLLTGSYGTLGIVTEVIFRLRPTPPSRCFLTASFPDEAAIAPVLAELLCSQQALTAIEVDWRAPLGPIAISVLLEGQAVSLERRVEVTAKVLAAARAGDGPPEGWGSLPGPVTLKVTAELASVPALLGLMRELATEHGLSPVVRGSAGTGVLFAGIDAPFDPTAIGAFLADLRAGCHLFGGSAIVLRAPASVKRALDVWGPVPALDLMARVKHQFDPERRLAPGRFAGGI